MRVYIYSIKGDKYLGKCYVLCQRQKKSVAKAIKRAEKWFTLWHRKYTINDIYSTLSEQIDNTPYSQYVYIAVKHR